VLVPFPVSCGHCFFCRHVWYSQCDNSNPNGEVGGLFGYSNTYGGYPGGQAEYLRVPYANVGPVIVPEELTDEQVLFCTDILPTSYWGIDISGMKSGDTVVVLRRKNVDCKYNPRSFSCVYYSVGSTLRHILIHFLNLLFGCLLCWYIVSFFLCYLE